MSSQVNKIEKPTGGKDFAGRFGAWWNGREYVPAEEGDEDEAGAVAAPAAEAPKTDEKKEADAPGKEAAEAVAADAKPDAADGEVPEEVKPKKTATASKKPATKPSIKEVTDETSSLDPRTDALETLWGHGRFEPGSEQLDALVCELLLGDLEGEGAIGFIGADPSLLKACAERDERELAATEWRAGCLPRTRELVESIEIMQGDVDRPRGFKKAGLATLASINGFAFADHKAGLVTSAHNALNETGRWVILDITRTTEKTPAAAFASAWAEALLPHEGEIEGLLDFARFGVVKRMDVTKLVVAAAKARFGELSSMLESAVKKGMEGGGGARFLQELVWDIQSWRSRLRALEGGALKVHIWVAEKGAESIPVTDVTMVEVASPKSVLDVQLEGLDPGDDDSLFE